MIILAGEPVGYRAVSMVMANTIKPLGTIETYFSSPLSRDRFVYTAFVAEYLYCGGHTKDWDYTEFESERGSFVSYTVTQIVCARVCERVCVCARARECV